MTKSLLLVSKKKISIPANSAKIKTFTLLSLPRSPRATAVSNRCLVRFLELDILQPSNDRRGPLLVIAEAQGKKRKGEGEGEKGRKRETKRRGTGWKEIQTVVKRELASQREFASHRIASIAGR